MKHVLLRLCFGVVIPIGLVACLSKPTEPSRVGDVSQSSEPIIGGKTDNRYPAIGALTASKRSFCTATLIASRLVLTAAHCTRSSVNGVEFRIETAGANGKPAFAYHPVASFTRHPQYSSGRNDIAVAVLKNDVTGVTPLVVNATAIPQSWVNTKVLFLGYGLLQTQPSLRAAGQKYSAEITMRTLRSDRFETRDSGTSICSGDSGGPALYKVGNDYQVIGVNSYVTGSVIGGRQPVCNGSGWSFRTDIYTSWLQPLMNKHGGKCTKDSDCGPCFRCDTQQGKCVLKGAPKTSTFCKPCASPQDCGGGGNICQRQAAGNRCLQACDTNGCCPLGTTCQLIGANRQCVPDKDVCPDVSCNTDNDCGPGEECKSGKCSPKPVSPAPKLCKKCQADADCDAGSTCHKYPDGGYCAQACAADNFCPTGYSCTQVGNKRYCLAAKGECACKADADCHTGDSCQKGICQRAGGGKYGDACGSTRKCATNFQCTDTSGGKACIQACKTEFPPGTPGSACGSSGRCNDGGRCARSSSGYICIKICSSSSQCNFGGTCTRAGSTSICTCKADSDCKRGYFCNTSVAGSLATCAPKAKPGAPCEKGFVCTQVGGSTDYCLPEPTQEAGQSCSGVDRCKAGHFCARTSQGTNVCIRSCSNDADCKGGGQCVSNGSARFCRCTSSCAAGYICKAVSSSTRVCQKVPCKADADCGDGNVCDQGFCSAKPECAKDEDCKAEQSCTAGKCVDKPTPPEPSAEPQARPEPGPAEPQAQPEPSAEPQKPAEPQAPGEVTKNVEPSPTDGGAQEPAKPTPPKGCGACSASSGSPAPSLGWLLGLFALGFLRRRP